MKLLAITLATLSLNAAWAAPAKVETGISTAESEVLQQRVEESKVSLNIFNTTETNRDVDNDFNGLANFLETVIGYKIDDKNSVSLYGEYTYLDNNEMEKSNYGLDVAELTYKRSKILTQDQNGVNMSAAVKVGRFVDPELVGLPKNDNYLQVRTTLQRDISDVFGVTAQFRAYRHSRNEDGVSGARKSEFRIYLTPEYSLTDKLTFGTTFNYRKRNVYGRDSKGRRFTSYTKVTPAFAYSFTDAFSAELYAETIPFVAHDSQTTASDWDRRITYGLTLSMNAF